MAQELVIWPQLSTASWELSVISYDSDAEEQNTPQSWKSLGPPPIGVRCSFITSYEYRGHSRQYAETASWGIPGFGQASSAFLSVLSALVTQHRCLGDICGMNEWMNGKTK